MCRPQASPRFLCSVLATALWQAFLLSSGPSPPMSADTVRQEGASPPPPSTSPPLHRKPENGKICAYACRSIPLARALHGFAPFRKHTAASGRLRGSSTGAPSRQPSPVDSKGIMGLLGPRLSQAGCHPRDTAPRLLTRAAGATSTIYAETAAAFTTAPTRQVEWQRARMNPSICSPWSRRRHPPI